MNAGRAIWMRSGGRAALPRESVSGGRVPRSLPRRQNEETPEDPAYLSRQLITCIGNKRALLPRIGDALARVKARLGKPRLRLLDAFSGSGVVSRFFKRHAELLISNDLETFAAVVGRCYLRNAGTVDEDAVRAQVDYLNQAVEEAPYPPGIIETLYAPRDEARITADDRVFYTRRNARRLDNFRRLIEALPVAERDLLLGPLLSEASIHANTAGVFKSFYKDRGTGIGKFGGTNADALHRITGAIRLEPPVLSRFECDVVVHQEDANALMPRLRDLDLAYLDPPYNQHPYGSNYFMLNLLVDYQPPARTSKVSGIPSDWRRSDYNVRSRCLERLRQLVESADARFVLVSSNNEGFIRQEEMREMLGRLGHVEVFETRYHAFRGSRSFLNRSVHVIERLFLLERR